MQSHVSADDVHFATCSTVPLRVSAEGESCKTDKRRLPICFPDLPDHSDEDVGKTRRSRMRKTLLNAATVARNSHTYQPKAALGGYPT
jgi:hypothetical protein